MVVGVDREVVDVVDVELQGALHAAVGVGGVVNLEDKAVKK